MAYMVSYIIIGLTLLITIGSQAYIKLMYSKTSKINSTRNISGKEVARKILDKNGLSHVKVMHISGELTDHYDPKEKVVRLSDGVYEDTSIAAISVAAHECGHAIQDKNNYLFLRIRSSLVPVVNLSSRLGYFAIAIGLIAGLFKIFVIGIIAEAVILLFQLITLPVEFNVSRRGLKQIEELDLVTSSEKGSAKSMLRSAALTYVAAVATAVLQILRLLLLFTSRD